jgi:hypothetical protein
MRPSPTAFCYDICLNIEMTSKYLELVPRFSDFESAATEKLVLSLIKKETENSPHIDILKQFIPIFSNMIDEWSV